MSKAVSELERLSADPMTQEMLEGIRRAQVVLHRRSRKDPAASKRTGGMGEPATPARVSLLGLMAMLLGACPDELPQRPPLPTRGDASTFDRSPLGLYFDASVPAPASDAGPADAGATVGELTVEVIVDGRPSIGATVLFHDASGRLLQSFSTGTDGRARTRDRAVVAASVAREYPQNVRDGVAVTQHDIFTWFDLPRDRDLVLLGGDVRRGPQLEAIAVSVTLPGPFPGAARYTVGSCADRVVVEDASAPATLRGSRCSDSTSTPLIVEALDAAGARLAHSSVMIPALGPAITEVDVTLPAWRTTHRTVRLRFAGVAERTALGSELAGFWGLGGLGRVGPMAVDEQPLASDLTFEVADLEVEVPLVIGARGYRGVASAAEQFLFFAELDAGGAVQRFDLARDIAAAPRGLALEQSNPRRPRLQLEIDARALANDAVAVSLSRRAGDATVNGEHLYTWRATALSAPSMSVQIPDLGPTLGAIIAAGPPTDRVATAFESDSFESYRDVLEAPYDLPDRDGPFPQRRRSSRAATAVRLR